MRHIDGVGYVNIPETVDAVPMSVIEDIKAEIEEAKLKARYVATMDGLSIALDIIDKHTEGR